jgi:hypothetical protein
MGQIEFLRLASSKKVLLLILEDSENTEDPKPKL